MLFYPQENRWEKWTADYWKHIDREFWSFKVSPLFFELNHIPWHMRIDIGVLGVVLGPHRRSRGLFRLTVEYRWSGKWPERPHSFRIEMLRFDILFIHWDIKD